MLKKTTRLALSLAIAAPLFILPQVYAAQLPETTVIATEQVLDNTPQAFTPQLMSININTATPADLTKLSGIGERKALRIVQWRQQNGDFKTISDLANVNGIGKATVAKLAGQLTVGN